ncbi:hypothetical protein A4X06_0g615 [Tilletia controversa]|uniref:Uncharacterized protein n=1 Tax=Tilletia controversa TaxID=13291 RepID=A0A8X7N070_9BASI|nr:hypothetical protein A4X06_0g615 [Tilletia controversa]
MQSFTALMLIAVLSVIGTVKSRDHTDIEALYYGCQQIADNCKDGKDADINDLAFDAFKRVLMVQMGVEEMYV